MRYAIGVTKYVKTMPPPPNARTHITRGHLLTSFYKLCFGSRKETIIEWSLQKSNTNSMSCLRIELISLISH